jgi:lipid-binding SYLF domain-containing protein
MKFHPLISIPVAALVFTVASYPVLAADDATKTVQSSNKVLQEFLSSDRIPRSILQRSQGIAIFPNVIQAGFFLGGQRGEGIMLVRDRDGRWSNPAIITATAGSIGLQFGAQSSDVVLVFQDAESIRKVYNSDFRLGGSVSGTAGPEGAEAVFPTDSTGNIYSYTKSEGLFGGVALSGIKVAYDDKKTGELYNRDQVTAQQVFTSRNITPPPTVRDLQRTLNRSGSAR